MDLTLSPSEEAFRDELRAWLVANDPGSEPEGDDAGLRAAGVGADRAAAADRHGARRGAERRPDRPRPPRAALHRDRGAASQRLPRADGDHEERRAGAGGLA